MSFSETKVKEEEGIRMVITTGENKLIDALESAVLKKECGHVYYDVERLNIGDILFKINGVVVCIVERKDINDYVASMLDGRLKEQTARLIQYRKENPNVIIIFLIEGPFVSKDHVWRGGITRSAFDTSCTNKIIRDGFYVLQTANPQGSALKITKLYDNLPEHWQNRNKILTPDEEKLNYLKTIKLVKKDNMTPDNAFVCQLGIIPNCSVDISTQIAKVYPSYKSLINKYDSLSDLDSKENLLSEIMLPIANNKEKRLGNVLSKRIYEYTCCDQLTTNISEPIMNVPEIKFKIKLKIDN